MLVDPLPRVPGMVLALFATAARRVSIAARTAFLRRSSTIAPFEFEPYGFEVPALVGALTRVTEGTGPLSIFFGALACLETPLPEMLPRLLEPEFELELEPYPDFPMFAISLPFLAESCLLLEACLAE
jgi:hypothetical protein